MTSEHGGPGAALVVGVGPGLGAALCRALAGEGYAVFGMGRSLADDGALAAAIRADAPGFRAITADAADAAAMQAAATQAQRVAPLSVLIYNASRLVRGPFESLAAADFEAAWRVTCLGAMVAAQACLPLMAARGRGAAIFTGATASLRGGAEFPAFASAKFALRGLAQSLSRAYWPKGVHVAHAIIDGGIGADEGRLLADDIAGAYMDVIAQPRSAWTQEFDLRPNIEKF